MERGTHLRSPSDESETDLYLGVKVSGHRGYFLTNDGVDLNLALINYGLDFLRKKGYKKVQAPFMMNKDMMSQTAQLEEFDEALYKVSLSLSCPDAQANMTRFLAQPKPTKSI